MSDFAKLVPAPADVDINSGLSPARASTLRKFLGKPGPLGEKCCPVSELSARLREKIVTRSVGPFRVTGHVEAVSSLAGIMENVQAKRPDLYAAVGTSGMLCCRRIRRPAGHPPSKSYSNHSWGMAVDIHFGERNDVQGDGKVQQGLLEIYTFFHQAGWYWGAEFGIEDGMHFEVAEETILAWHKAGRI